MKSNLILMAVAAAALSFTACNKKIDEKTMGEIKQFETDWTATGTAATTWSQDLAAETQKSTEHITKQTAMMTASMDKMKDQAMKDKLMEMDKADKDANTQLTAMTTEWNNFNTEWTANTTAWTEWKAKVDKGEVSNEEATKALTEWNAKMAAAKEKMAGWNTQYATLKTNCENNMAACDAAMGSMTTAEATTSGSTMTKTPSNTKMTNINGQMNNTNTTKISKVTKK